MNDNIVKVSVSCQNNPKCIFDREDIILKIAVENTANHDIGLPVSYLQRKGVYCLLTDKRTNKKMEMGVSLTPPSLQREFVRISPGQQIMLFHRLGADLIGSIGNKMADFTAKVEVGGLLELQEGEEPIRFIEEATISIQGKDAHSQ